MARLHITCKAPEQPAPEGPYPRINVEPGIGDCEVLVVEDDGSKHPLYGVTALSFSARGGESTVATLVVLGATCDVEDVPFTTSVRGSGRTYRMLTEALAAAERGERVLVVGGEVVREMLLRRATCREVVERITFASPGQLEEGRFRGREFDATFEDHAVLEDVIRAWRSTHVRPMRR